MPSWTPKALAAELGVSASAVRQWLRDEVDRGGETGPWLVDDDLAARIRAHFAATATAREQQQRSCSVEGCDRAAHGRGWCRAHYQRWCRTGSADGIGGGGHQRAKTHCPHGHEYTPENTIVYPSDGRRRCRRCRRRATG
ncbi:hypothetical protein [Cellulosimicrobium aquatile]|uniref:hypothetical protein n=1 Tax=Cellulosimicrobium aquatile TaxID=1612203 RepID=UPI00145978DB|nr:hypothetical protein [Cellulosimicrobium aquatile]NMF28888.1 hypothetical protein [Cellulosimicrobium aquatile]